MITDPLLKSSCAFSTSTNTVRPVLDDKMDAQGVEQIIKAGPSIGAYLPAARRSWEYYSYDKSCG